MGFVAVFLSNKHFRSLNEAYAKFNNIRSSELNHWTTITMWIWPPQWCRPGAAEVSVKSFTSTTQQQRPWWLPWNPSLLLYPCFVSNRRASTSIKSSWRENRNFLPYNFTWIASRSWKNFKSPMLKKISGRKYVKLQSWGKVQVSESGKENTKPYLCIFVNRTRDHTVFGKYWTSSLLNIFSSLFCFYVWGMIGVCEGVFMWMQHANVIKEHTLWCQPLPSIWFQSGSFNSWMLLIPSHLAYEFLGMPPFFSSHLSPASLELQIYTAITARPLSSLESDDLKPGPHACTTELSIHIICLFLMLCPLDQAALISTI